MRYGYFRDLAPPSHHAQYRLHKPGNPARLAAPRAGTRELLVLSVSAGAGHVRAAEAICGYLDDSHSAVAARHIDVMDYASPALRKVYTGLYMALIKRFPSLWSQIYHRTDRSSPNGLFERLRRAVEHAGVARLLDEIARAEPAAIICIHFLPAGILARLRRSGRLNCPVWVQVTDFYLHRMWVHSGISGYFAGNEEIAFRLREKGVPAHAIRVTGILVMPEFRQPRQRADCARELGIDPARTTLLLMGGGRSGQAGPGGGKPDGARVRFPADRDGGKECGRAGPPAGARAALSGPAARTGIYRAGGAADGLQRYRYHQAGRAHRVRVSGNGVADDPQCACSRAGRAQCRLSARAGRSAQGERCGDAALPHRRAAGQSRQAGGHAQPGSRAAALGRADAAREVAETVLALRA